MKISERFVKAGKHLLSADFGSAFKSLTYNSTTLLSPDTYRGGNNNGFWFFGNNGVDYHFSYAGHNSSLTAYRDCPPVSAIINRKAQAYINGKTWILNSKGKEATTEQAKKIRALMKRPNALQSWKQFEAQGYIYQQLFGYNIILPIKPFGFKENIDASALWNIPPYMVDIEETNKLFYQSDTRGIIKQIVLNYKGTRTIISAEDVYIMKDFTPSFDSLIIPESRICALKLPINNIIGAYESRNVLINYRGALGILTHEPGNGQYVTTPLTPEDKEGLQNDFRSYGLKNKQWKFIITSAALKWQQMGVSTKDLMLFEEIEDDIMRLCDGFNFPYELMSSGKGVTFSNRKEAEKVLYQDGIMPEAESMYEQWGQFWNAEDYNLNIEKDFTNVPALQQDELYKSQARKARNEALLIEFQNDLITLNRWLELNGEDTRPDGDVYYSELRARNNSSNNQNNSDATQGQQQEAEAESE
jgi:hypothetical protein